MIYLFYGNDFKKIAEEKKKLMELLTNEKPDTVSRSFDAENVSSTIFEELISSQGLFERRMIIVLDEVCTKKETLEFFEKEVNRFEGSQNVFIFTEEKPHAALLSVYKKHAHKIWKYEMKSLEEDERSFLFQLTDAIGERNRKNAWVLLNEASLREIAPEQIHGTVFWQIKTLLMVKEADFSPQKESALKLHPFVLKKNKSFCKNFSAGELQKLSSALVSSYHEAHRGGEPLPVALERFVLGL